MNNNNTNEQKVIAPMCKEQQHQCTKSSINVKKEATSHRTSKNTNTNKATQHETTNNTTRKKHQQRKKNNSTNMKN
jgi:hypothetical protein